MSSDQQTTKVYQNHRDNQYQRILEAAEKLFVRDGLDNVSISAIAEAASISRKTLYEYFPNKQEIVWGIIENFAEEYKSTFMENVLSEGNGFQQIEYFLKRLLSPLEDNIEHIRFISEFDTLYAREGNPHRVRHSFEIGIDALIKMIQTGIEDGSIRPDLNPELLASAILNLVSGMNSRFATLGTNISEEYGQSFMDIYHEICRNFLRGIQSS